MPGDETPRRYRTAETPWGTAEGERRTLSLRPDPDGGTSFRGLDYTFVSNPDEPDATVEITLHHRRRAKAGGPWPVEPLKLTSLRASDWVRLELNSSETLALYRHLQALFAIGAGGVPPGDRSVQVVEGDAVVARGDLAELIALLATRHGQDELAEGVAALLPDPVALVALKREHEVRSAAVEEFQEHLEACDWTEIQWQSFFRGNDWIFGHGLDYQFLVHQQSQPDYGSEDFSGRGGQRGDELFSTAGDRRFAVLVELKKPQTRLVGEDDYRNGAWSIHAELSGGIAQLQANAESFYRKSQSGAKNVRYLDERGIAATATPKSILLIGSTSQLDNDDKRATFERFRRHLWNPEVLTYDELLARARFLVARVERRPDAGAHIGLLRPPKDDDDNWDDRFSPVDEASTANPDSRDPDPDWWSEPGDPGHDDESGDWGQDLPL